MRLELSRCYSANGSAGAATGGSRDSLVYLPDLDVPWLELALRWAAFTPGVNSVLFGARHAAGRREGIDAVERGPLQGEILSALQAAHARAEVSHWPALI